MSTVYGERDALLQVTVPRFEQGFGNSNNATVFIFKRTTTNTAPAGPSVTSVYTFATGLITGLNNGWTINVPDAAGGGYLWVSQAYASQADFTATILSTDWSTVRLHAKDGAPGADGLDGLDGPRFATARVYQWSTSTPAAPLGTSTWTWSSGVNSAYSSSDGWSVSVPSNPGTPLVRLYVAEKPITAAASVTTSTVSYSSATVAAWSQNGATGSAGATGVQSGAATVYQWAATIPAGPSGSPTWTWATQSFGAAPSGWSLTPGIAPSPGYTLWAATVHVADSAANATTSFNWSAAAVMAVGYAGSNGGAGAEGASYVTAYCASSTASTTTAPSATTGRTSLPATNSGGITGTYSATVPTLTSGQFLYQTDGIYNPATNQVTWTIPYWSSLKVATLSAITANLGAINAGSINLGGGVFTVDNAGNLVCQSIIIQKTDGTVLFNSTAGLTTAGAAAGTLNSDISISSTGVLSGGATGQMTTIATVDGGAGTTLFGQRGHDDAPNQYPTGTTRQFKISAAVGLGGADNFLTLETLIQYSDATGGSVYQYAYRGTTTWRRWADAGASSWPNAWVQDIDRNVYTGDLNATVGAPSGTNVGSTPATTVESGAANGATALAAVNDTTTGLAARLRNNAANVLSGGAGVVAGTLTYNATTGARIAGSGTALTQFGLVNYASDGTLNFSMSASGIAVKADVSGSTGTFGDVIIGTSLRCTATAYGANGFWVGLVSGVPKLSIVHGTVSLLYDPSAAHPLTLTDPVTVKTIPFAVSSSPTSGGYSFARNTGYNSLGSYTASSTGGTGTISYVFSLDQAGTPAQGMTSYIEIIGTTVYVYGKGTITASCDIFVTITAIDGSGVSGTPWSINISVDWT